jgi:hypothetical protein
MTKHITDSERLTLAMLNKKETELKQAQEEIDQLKRQLKAMSGYITELKDSNKLLASQVNFLIRKQTTHA